MTTQETTLDVQGMTCGACVRHVNQALREVDGVREVEVDLRGGKVRVAHENASVDTLREALLEAGYASRLPA